MKVYNRDRFKSAFTLIELLVVLAILVIVAGFLFPTVDQAPYKAARIRCVNNLKQVGLSFRLYAGDNRDRYPMNISANDEPVERSAAGLSISQTDRERIGHAQSRNLS